MAYRKQEIIIPADLPLVQELGATLREWVQIWQKLFVVRVDHFVSSTHSSFTAGMHFHLSKCIFYFFIFFAEKKKSSLLFPPLNCGVYITKRAHVFLTGKQDNPVQECAADGLQPHRVSISDCVRNAAQG